MSNTEKIFLLSAPYDNPYQGTQPRWLFVCSAGLLRSPTGAWVGSQLGLNTRSCGVDPRALIPMSVNLISWAAKIVFVDRDSYLDALNTFTPVGYDDDIRARALIMDIPDSYNAFDPWLVEQFRKLIALHGDSTQTAT